MRITETIDITIPVTVEFDYFPADPSTGFDPGYNIYNVSHMGKSLMLSESDSSQIIDTLEFVRQSIIEDSIAARAEQLALYDEDDIS